MSACTSANRVGAPESLRLFTYEKRVISFSNLIPSGHLWIIWINIKSCSSSSFVAALSTVPIIFDRINLAPTSLYHWRWWESFYWKMDHRSGEGVKVLCSADYQYFFLGKPIENFLPSCIMSSRSTYRQQTSYFPQTERRNLFSLPVVSQKDLRETGRGAAPQSFQSVHSLTKLDNLKRSKEKNVFLLVHFFFFLLLPTTV